MLKSATKLARIKGVTTVISFKSGRGIVKSIISVGTKAGVDNQEL